MGSVAYGPSPCPAVPAVPSLALPADPQPHRRARARVNPCPCPKPARQPEFQPPHQPLWAGTPDLSIPSIPSQVLMGNEHYFQTLTKQPFILLFLFFPLSKSPPPLGSSLQGMRKEKDGKQRKYAVLPQHILPAAPGFPVPEKNFFSTQISNRVGAPALETAPSQQAPPERNPRLPAPDNALLPTGLLPRGRGRGDASSWLPG